MKKYTWNDGEKIHAHCFSDGGIYIGFQPHNEELQADYSQMVFNWVKEQKTEKDLEQAMTNMGFALEHITDTTCKYGHLLGWNTENDCYKCSDCGELIPLKNGETKPVLISEVK